MNKFNNSKSIKINIINYKLYYNYKNIFSDLNFYPDIYSPNYKSLKPEIVRKLKLKKIKIIPWTVNSNDDIAEVLNMGVDGIISDYPDRVIKFLYGKEI